MTPNAPKRGRPAKDKAVTDLATQIGKKLKQAREERRLTQEEVGQYLGIGRAGYANIETGRSLLQVDHLMKLPRILQKPITYFLGIENDLAIDEAELLQLYRIVPPGIGRETIMDVAKSLAERFRKQG